MASDDTGANYTFNVSPTVGGTVLVDIAAGIAADEAGNPNGAADRFMITYDRIPTFVYAFITGNHSITAVYTEPVTSVPLHYVDIVLNNTGTGTVQLLANNASDATPVRKQRTGRVEIGHGRHSTRRLVRARQL